MGEWGRGGHQGIELEGKNSISVLTWHTGFDHISQCLVHGIYYSSTAALPSIQRSQQEQAA